MEDRIARLAEEARKDNKKARGLINWLCGSIQAIEVGLDSGESLGKYVDELKYMRSYVEGLSRIAVESYGCEKAIEAIKNIDNNKEELK